MATSGGGLLAVVVTRTIESRWPSWVRRRFDCAGEPAEFLTLVGTRSSWREPRWSPDHSHRPQRTMIKRWPWARQTQVNCRCRRTRQLSISSSSTRAPTERRSVSSRMSALGATDYKTAETPHVSCRETVLACQRIDPIIERQRRSSRPFRRDSRADNDYRRRAAYVLVAFTTAGGAGRVGQSWTR
jgi:hypothetical protein